MAKQNNINWIVMATLLAQMQEDLEALRGKIVDNPDAVEIMGKINRSADEVISTVMPEVRRQMEVA